MILFLRDGRRRPVAWLGTLLALGLAARALATDALFARATGDGLFMLLALCHGNAAILWLFSRAMFEENFRISSRYIAIWAATMAMGFIAASARMRGADPSIASAIFETLNISFALSAVWFAWKDLTNDLVERRRHARFLLVALAGTYVLLTVAIRLDGQSETAILLRQEINSIGLLVVAIALSWTVSGLSRELFGSDHSTGLAVRSTSRPVQPVSDLSLAEARLLTRLNRLMEEERAYRNEELTIGALAVALGVREYELRRLINRQLGYKNFSHYLNGWRLGEARAALSDLSQISVPISTIALDAGFRSLGPFNRAFKAVEGITPSEFRQRMC